MHARAKSPREFANLRLAVQVVHNNDEFSFLAGRSHFVSCFSRVLTVLL